MQRRDGQQAVHQKVEFQSLARQNHLPDLVVGWLITEALIRLRGILMHQFELAFAREIRRTGTPGDSECMASYIEGPTLALGDGRGTGGRGLGHGPGGRSLRIRARQFTRDAIGAWWASLVTLDKSVRAMGELDLETYLDTAFLALIASVTRFGMRPSRRHADYQVVRAVAQPLQGERHHWRCLTPNDERTENPEKKGRGDTWGAVTWGMRTELYAD